MSITIIIINVSSIAVDCPFKIQMPLLSLNNSSPTVTITPITAAAIAEAAELFFVNSPNKSGAVIDTDISE